MKRKLLPIGIVLFLIILVAGLLFLALKFDLLQSIISGDKNYGESSSLISGINPTVLGESAGYSGVRPKYYNGTYWNVQLTQGQYEYGRSWFDGNDFQITTLTFPQSDSIFTTTEDFSNRDFKSVIGLTGHARESGEIIINFVK